MAETREERRARVRTAETLPEQTAAPTREWLGWVVIDSPQGWRWCRVALPESVVEAHRVGEPHAPDRRGIMAARIEAELVSDHLVTRRGWSR